MATMQGVYITVLGMAILFAALLILTLAAMALERLFRPEEIEKKASSESDRALVAAIAVAIALKLKRQASSVKRQTAEGEVSGWKFLGRHGQLMGSRKVKGRRR